MLYFCNKTLRNENNLIENRTYKSFEQKIEELTNDFENGSSAIALKALEIFTEEIESVILSLSKNEIETIKNKIIAVKPAMAAVKNIIESAFHLFQKGITSKNIQKQIIDRIEIATGNVVEHANNNIIGKNYHAIATCSFSSTVMKVFKQLMYTGHQFNVLAFESQWNKRDYADTVMEKCRINDIEAVKFNKDEFLKSDYDCGLIGADAIIPGKGVVNGIPSKLFSELLKEKEKPLFVVAESFKKSNQIHIDDGFDFIPNVLLTQIFMDEIF